MIKSIGTWITISNPTVVEVLSSANFDFMVVDMEHSAITISECVNLIRTIQAVETKAYVRVSKNEEVVLKQVLDAGADGVIIPMIKSSTDLEQAIRYIKYPPNGERGVGLSRAHQYGVGFDEYVSWLSKDVKIVAQIEHIDAVKNLDEILKNNDLNSIIIGPYDLSGSMGKPGRFNDKEVKDAIKIIEDKCNKSNVQLGSHVIYPDHKEVIDLEKRGYEFIAFSIDFFFLGEMARLEMNKLKIR